MHLDTVNLDIDPDIRRARTPVAALYTDPAVHRVQAERVFARSWQFLDGAAPPEGEVRPFVLLEGCLDEHLLWTHPRGAEARVVSNVCTHRGHPVCLEAGAREGLRCMYHGRRYRIDGTFEHMPEFEGVHDFPAVSDDLARLPVESLGPMAFAALTPGAPFGEWLGALLTRVGWLPFDELVPAPERARDYEVEANWALYCENYLEGLHIPFVHRGLNAVIEFARYEHELLPHGTLQIAFVDGDRDRVAFDPPPGTPDHGRRVAAYYYWLFPNLMLNLYPWGVSLNHVQPRGHGRCRVAFRPFVWDEDLLDEGAGGDLDTVELEDEAVVEAVQRALGSRLYHRGRYSPSHEVGTHHFHRMLGRAMTRG